MKLNKIVLLSTLLLSTAALANSLSSPVKNIDVVKTTASHLSVQNLSDETVNVNIFGDEVKLSSGTGAAFDCKGYDELELVIGNGLHDFFEVPCQSKVIINESFKNSL